MWFTGEGRPPTHTHTHTHSEVLQPFTDVGRRQFKPIFSILHSRTPTSQISGPSKSIKGRRSYMHYTISNLKWWASTDNIIVSIREFFSVEKCKDIKYFLSLILQDYLGKSCNTNSQFISMNSFSNTDWAFNMCLKKTLYLISRTIIFIITVHSGTSYENIDCVF